MTELSKPKFYQLIAVIAVIAIAFCSSPSWAEKETEKKTENTSKEVQKIVNRNVGHDPHNFKTASDMYRVADTKPFDDDEAAIGLVENVTGLINNGAALSEIGDNGLHMSMKKLNPYRKAPLIQAAIPVWAELLSMQIGKSSSGPSSLLVAEANREYTSGNFEKASIKYAALLSDFPRHLDARNNYALTQIHLGYDLLAELELELLKRLNKEYVPALINLTVVYERLGQPEKARLISEEASKLNQMTSHFPAAKFNHAWYLNLEGKFEDAKKVLQEGERDPLSLLEAFHLSVKEKSQALYDLNQRQIKNSLPLRKKILNYGLVGIYGWEEKTGKLIIFVGYLVLQLVISCMIYKAFRRRIAFLSYLVIGVFFHLICWGFPPGQEHVNSTAVLTKIGCYVFVWNIIMSFLFRNR